MSDNRYKIKSENGIEIIGNTTITGNITASAGIAIPSGYVLIGTASYAETASYAMNGGGSNSEIGIVTLNFGSPPGTNITTASILTSNVNDNSSINIYIMNTSSVDHNTADHQIFALYSKVIPGNIINNTSFDITGISDLRINGTFKVKYIINN